MTTSRARALVLSLVVIAVGGAVARTSDDAPVAAPCPSPARRGAAIVCDGDGDDLGARAWLFGRRLDINTARAGDLERIPGVGRRLAERIVDERARRGRFGHLDELDAVEGVGPKLLATLGAWVEVRDGSGQLR
jgi:competence protein ComEA